MKNFFEINRALVAKKKIIMIIMAVALYALPAMALNDMDFRSTSTMQGLGKYVAPVTAVGASSAASATTYSPAKAPSGPRKDIIQPGNPGNQSNEPPIGDAVLPLMLMAVAFCGVIYYRRKKALSR